MRTKHAAIRSVAAAALIGAAAAPPALAAVARRTVYMGKVTQGGTAQIVAVAPHGKVTRIGLELSHVRATCKQGSVTADFFALDEPVKHDAFFISRHHMVFKGQFQKAYQSVHGTARLRGDLGRYTHCTTGTLHWSARAVHR